MGKRVFIFGILFILLLSFASASLFSDFFNKITGNAVGDSSIVPVYSFWNPTIGDHFYVASQTQPQTPQGYTSQGIIFYAHNRQVQGTVPVHRFYNPEIKDHFYTRFAQPVNFEKYTYEIVAFYAYPSEIQNTFPVYRFWNPVIGDHFLSKSLDNGTTFNSLGRSPEFPNNPNAYKLSYPSQGNYWKEFVEFYVFNSIPSTTEPTPTCIDKDKDNFGNPASPLCTFPQLDCNDADSSIYPGSVEICDDKKDNNCDGKTDFQDASCQNVSPGLTITPIEICNNGIDDDGDGFIDESCEETQIKDITQMKFLGEYDITAQIGLEIPLPRYHQIEFKVYDANSRKYISIFLINTTINVRTNLPQVENFTLTLDATDPKNIFLVELVNISKKKKEDKTENTAAEDVAIKNIITKVNNPKITENNVLAFKNNFLYLTGVVDINNKVRNGIFVIDASDINNIKEPKFFEFEDYENVFNAHYYPYSFYYPGKDLYGDILPKHVMKISDDNKIYIVLGAKNLKQRIIVYDIFGQTSEEFLKTDEGINFASCDNQFSDIRPIRLRTGENLDLSFIFKNKGLTTWSRENGFELVFQDESKLWSIIGTNIDTGEQIFPGENKRFNFNLQSPLKGGAYNVSWQMSRNGKTFGEKCSLLLEVSNAEGTIPDQNKNICTACGKGFLNLCDADECYSISSICKFNSRIIIGGTCDISNEICHNGIDDDGNGLTDCQDSQCATGKFCTINPSKEIYSNEVNIKQFGRNVISNKEMIAVGGLLITNDNKIPAKQLIKIFTKNNNIWTESQQINKGSIAVGSMKTEMGNDWLFVEDESKIFIFKRVGNIFEEHSSIETGFNPLEGGAKPFKSLALSENEKSFAVSNIPAEVKIKIWGTKNWEIKNGKVNQLKKPIIYQKEISININNDVQIYEFDPRINQWVKTYTAPGQKIEERENEFILTLDENFFRNRRVFAPLILNRDSYDKYVENPFSAYDKLYNNSIEVLTENGQYKEGILQIRSNITIDHSTSEFGKSIDIKGDTVIVGSPREGIEWIRLANTVFEDAYSEGAIYVYEKNSLGKLVLKQKLRPAEESNPETGNIALGRTVRFLENDDVIIAGGAKNAFVYIKNAQGNWVEHSKIVNDVGKNSMVATSGNNVLIGGIYGDSSFSVFTWDPVSKKLTKKETPNLKTNFKSGLIDIDIYENHIVVGEPSWPDYTASKGLVNVQYI